jgi:hypothetical protein
MLNINQLIGFAAGGSSGVLTYIGQNTVVNPGDPHTFVGAAIGAAAANRRVFVAIALADTTTATFNSITIGGISATIHIQASSTQSSVCIASAVVSTGTTANIVIDTSLGNPEDIVCLVYAAYGFLGTTPFDTATDTADPVSMLIDIPANGFVIAVAQHGASAVAFTFTGITEDYQATVAGMGNRMAGGSAKNLNAQTNRTVTLDGGTGACVGVAVSWA